MSESLETEVWRELDLNRETLQESQRFRRICQASHALTFAENRIRKLWAVSGHSSVLGLR
jgi:hypothetical protein